MSQPLYDWFVHLPDNPNMLQTRLENRPKHLEHNQPLMDSAKIFFGGPMLSAQPTSPEDGMTKIIGSIHVIKSASEEEVWELVKDDPYAKLEVWDMERVSVTPMKVFVNQPM
ncbi:hypothetical protein KCU73_g1114, partial [Aureobasidium melanogenum]